MGALKVDVAEFNRLVGVRLRRRRRDLGLSQSDVARTVGITFQQIQKYEGGATIMASRLAQLAHALETPISYFFDGLTTATGEGPGQRPAQRRPFAGQHSD